MISREVNQFYNQSTTHGIIRNISPNICISQNPSGLRNNSTCYLDPTWITEFWENKVCTQRLIQSTKKEQFTFAHIHSNMFLKHLLQILYLIPTLIKYLKITQNRIIKFKFKSIQINFKWLSPTIPKRFLCWYDENQYMRCI